MPSELVAYTADRIFDGRSTLLGHAVVADAQTKRIIDVVAADQVPLARRCHGSLCPGFVNAHGHLELSHLHGAIDPGTGLVPFLMAVTRLRDYPEEEIQEAFQAAESVLRLAGVVGMGDISNTPATAQLKRDSAIRFHTFVEVFGMNPDSARAGLERGLQVKSEFLAQGLGTSLSPHAPYSVHAELLATLGDRPLSIHMQESPEEDALFREGNGAFLDFYREMGLEVDLPPAGPSSLQYTLGSLKEAGRLLLVHNTCAREADLMEAEASPQDVFWCLCPEANRYIEGRLPDLALFLERPDRILIGTDSLASNASLSPLRELIALRTTAADPEPALLVRWATLNGAFFFGWEEDLGSLEVGKSPGINLIGEADDGSPIGPGSTLEVLLDACSNS